LTLLASDGTRVGLVEGLEQPEGVGSDGHGGVLLSETVRDRILHYDAQLQPLGTVGSGWTRPMGVEVDSSGRLFIADTYGNRVLGMNRADSEPAGAGGTVAPTLNLSVSGGQFGAFVPGVARTYTASVSADVLSTGGDAALSVSDPSPNAPGRLGQRRLRARAAAAGRGLAAARDRQDLAGARLARPGDDRALAVDRRHRAVADRRLGQDAHLHAEYYGPFAPNSSMPITGRTLRSMVRSAKALRSTSSPRALPSAPSSIP
jgi:hypothetical protein